MLWRNVVLTYPEKSVSVKNQVCFLLGTSREGWRPDLQVPIWEIVVVVLLVVLKGTSYNNFLSEEITVRNSEMQVNVSVCAFLAEDDVVQLLALDK